TCPHVPSTPGTSLVGNPEPSEQMERDVTAMTARRADQRLREHLMRDVQVKGLGRAGRFPAEVEHLVDRQLLGAAIQSLDVQRLVIEAAGRVPEKARDEVAVSERADRHLAPGRQQLAAASEQRLA